MTEEFDVADVDETGWARFLDYGRRIRLYHPTYNDRLPSHETLEAIKSRMETTELTSGLRELHLHIRNDRHAALSSILSSKSLERLVLRFYHEAHEIDAVVICQVLSQAVQLRELQISADAYYVPDSSFLQTLQQAAPKLEKLEKVFFEFAEPKPPHLCHPFPQLPETIKSFGCSLPVTRLSLRVFSCATWPTEAGFREGLFWKLTSINVKANLTSISSCFPGMPKLISLNTKSVWPEDVSTLDNFLACASMHLQLLRILNVEVAGMDEEDGEVGEAPLTYTTLSQHPIVHKLWAFEIIWPTILKGSNDDLSALVSHMPELFILGLITSGSPNFMNIRETDLTPDILHIVAHHCPNICEVHLVIDIPFPLPQELQNKVYSGFRMGPWRGPTIRCFHENRNTRLDKFLKAVLALNR